MSKRPIYLDYHATTPVDSRVLDAMTPYWSMDFGNPSSRQHAYGWTAEKAIENAREQVANLIGAQPKEIYFTSGGTEANNLALKGYAEATGTPLKLISAKTEHKAIYETALYLAEKKLVQLIWLKLDSEGQVEISDFESQLRQSSEALVSLMWANNEIGTLHPISQLASISREYNAIVHCDAVQALGHHPIDVSETQVDMVSLSSHKIYGPKGVGALFIRKKSPRIRVQPQILGGGHELGLRSGSLNVPGIVGFGKACEIMSLEGITEARRLSELRDFMIGSLMSKIPGAKLIGSAKNRLCNNLSILFTGTRSADILAATLGELAISTGSACLSQSGGSLGGASHVLKAIGLTDQEAGATIRLGLGRYTTKEEIESAVETLERATLRRKK